MAFSPDGLYTARGETHTLAEWAEITGISRTTLIARVKKQPPNEPFENALSKVLTPKLYAINGDAHTLKEWAEITGIHWNTLHTRIKRMKEGDSFESVIHEIAEIPTYEAYGEKHTLAEWAEKIGVNKRTLWSRLDRKKPEDPFETILYEKKDPRKYYEAYGEIHSLKEWADIIGIKKSALSERLHKKSPDEPFESILYNETDPTKYTAFGEEHTLAEWSTILGIRGYTLFKHLYKSKTTSLESILLEDFESTTTSPASENTDLQGPESLENNQKAESSDPKKSSEEISCCTPKDRILYLYNGTEHTIYTWSDILNIPYPWLYRMVHDRRMSLEDAKNLYHPNNKDILNSSKQDLTRFIPGVGYKQVKEKYANDPGKLFQWNCFYNRMRRNPFPRKFLFKQQRGICPICNKKLDLYQTWMHFINYDHLCTFVSTPKDLITICNPSKNNPKGNEKVPDCELCRYKCTSKFNNCMANFVLVHGTCNQLLAFNNNEEQDKS